MHKSVSLYLKPAQLHSSFSIHLFALDAPFKSDISTKTMMDMLTVLLILINILQTPGRVAAGHDS